MKEPWLDVGRHTDLEMAKQSIIKKEFKYGKIKYPLPVDLSSQRKYLLLNSQHGFKQSFILQDL